MMTHTWLAKAAKDIDQISREYALSSQEALTFPRGSLGVMQYVTADFAGWQGQAVPLCADVTLQAFRSNSDSPSTMQNNSPARNAGDLSDLAGRLHSDYSVSQIEYLNKEPQGTRSIGSYESSSTNYALAEGYRVGTADQHHLLVGMTLADSNTRVATEVYETLLENPDSPVEMLLKKLHTLGGIEFAALTGAFIGAAHVGVPVLVNGFVATAAALLAVRLNPSVRQWMLFSHAGTSDRQSKALRALNAEPILDEKLDVCEQSALATAIQVIRSALGLHQRMSFATQATARLH